MSLGIVKVKNILVVGVMVHDLGLAAAVDINGPIKRGEGGLQLLVQEMDDNAGEVPQDEF